MDIKRSWYDAKKFCEERGGYLPEITAANLQESLHELTRKLGGNGVNFMTGAHVAENGVEWRWINSGKNGLVMCCKRKINVKYFLSFFYLHILHNFLYISRYANQPKILGPRKST